MRWLVILIVACASNVPPKAVTPPTPEPPAVRPSPPAARPPADPIAIGHPLDRDITAPQIHRYRVSAAANTVITGVVEQKGIDLEVVTYDAAGTKLKVFDSPNGENGPEPFIIQAAVAGDYDFEVRQVELPPDAPPDLTMSSHGAYHAEIKIETEDEYAFGLAQEQISSPRILAVWHDVHLHHAAAVDAFWTSLAGKGPIVEPYPGVAEDSLVTFVMKAKSPYVGVVGVMDFREKPLLKIGDSDLWYLTARMPADSRLEYAFVVADNPPPLVIPYRPNGNGGGRFQNIQTDPNNPTQHGPFSRIELPGATPQPFIAPKPDSPKGAIKPITIDSKHVPEKREVGVYLPPGHDPKLRYPLLIVFDGEAYGMRPGAQIALPAILDNMIAAKKIPPIVAALVANQGLRTRDLTNNEAFGAFIAGELVPRMRSEFHAGFRPDDVIVTGSSLGGLASTYVAFHHPDVIGKVLSQSGSYQFIPAALDHDIPQTVEGNGLTREIAAAPRKPIKFYVETGLFEGILLDSNRHFRDVLVAKGYPLTYREFHGGHDYWVWRGTISDGLIALLGPRP